MWYKNENADKSSSVTLSQERVYVCVEGKERNRNIFVEVQMRPLTTVKNKSLKSELSPINSIIPDDAVDWRKLGFLTLFLQ